MKTFVSALFLSVWLLSPPFANDGPNKADFLIDASKHYVYLKFDHVGERQPLSAGEPGKGLWLRLVNNCRFPIIVAVFNTENGEPDRGVGVYDEIVKVPRKGALRTFDAPGKAQLRRAAPIERDPPEGYALSEVFSTTTISPGGILLFNLPVNHVSPTWYLQIRFYFELPGEGYGTGPYSARSTGTTFLRSSDGKGKQWSRSPSHLSSLRAFFTNPGGWYTLRIRSRVWVAHPSAYCAEGWGRFALRRVAHPKIRRRFWVPHPLQLKGADFEFPQPPCLSLPTTND